MTPEQKVDQYSFFIESPKDPNKTINVVAAETAVQLERKNTALQARVKELEEALQGMIEWSGVGANDYPPKAVRIARAILTATQSEPKRDFTAIQHRLQ